MTPTEQQHATDATENNNPPLAPWSEVVRDAEAALARLRATLDEMKEVSDAMGKLIVKQLDPTAIDEPGAEAAQPN